MDCFGKDGSGLKSTLDPQSGCWFQAVDKGDRQDNWTDTSGSAMFTYTSAREIELGMLDKTEYAPAVEKRYQGIIANAATAPVFSGPPPSSRNRSWNS
jgi:unsaturated rhamnogalacturonyl hydrolase